MKQVSSVMKLHYAAKLIQDEMNSKTDLEEGYT